MYIQVMGNSGTFWEVDPNSRAGHAMVRPIDVGVLGSYAITFSGTVAAGLSAASPIFSMRWTDLTRISVFRNIRFSMQSLGIAFAAGTAFIELNAVRQFQPNFDTGGTLLSLASNAGKRRTSFGSSLITDIRINLAGTNIVTGGGNRTVDTTGLAAIRFGTTTTTNAIQLPTTAIWAPDFIGEWPFIVAQNDGFIIRATVPATGIWGFEVGIEWSELQSF